MKKNKIKSRRRFVSALWIGFFEVRPLPGNDGYGKNGGSFMYAFSWAAGRANFIKKIRAELKRLKFHIVSCEEVEPWEKRIGNQGVSDLHQMLAANVNRTKAIIFSSFHIFPG